MISALHVREAFRLPKEWRVLSAIRRFAWGNLSDYAVDRLPKLDAADPEPRPLTQDDLASALGLGKSSVSEACTYLREQGYLLPNSPLLYPDDKQPSLVASQKAPDSTANFNGVSSDSTNFPSPFVRFKAAYLTENQEFSAIYATKCADRERLYAEARACGQEIREMDRRILGAFRNWRRQNDRESDSPDGNGGSQNLPPSGTDSDSTGGGSDSGAERFGTPGLIVRDSSGVEPDSRIPNALTAKEINADGGGLYNPEALTFPTPSSSSAPLGGQAPTTTTAAGPSTAPASGWLAGAVDSEPASQPAPADDDGYQNLLDDLRLRGFALTSQNVAELRARLPIAAAAVFLNLLDEAIAKKKRNREAIGRGLVLYIAKEAADAYQGIRQPEEEEARRQRDHERQYVAQIERDYIETLRAILTNPLSEPAEIAEARAHPALADFQPDPAAVQNLFDHHVTKALRMLQQTGAPAWCELLERAERINPERLLELRKLHKEKGSQP